MACAIPAAAVIACTVSQVLAQDFLSVPYVVTAEPAAFRDLFSTARSGPGLHALIIGDSQETCPTSYGINYVPAFNAAWALRYGVSPRTPLVQPGLSFTFPAGEWLVCARNLSPLLTTPSQAFAADALPGLANWVLPAPTGDQRGWAMLLQPRANGVNPALPINHGRSWFDGSQGAYLDVFALRDAGSVTVTITVVSGEDPGATGSTLLAATTSPSSTPDAGPVERYRIGPINWTPVRDSSLQAEFVGGDPMTPAHLVSASFASVAADAGLTATDIAAGGYTAVSLQANHAAALQHLRGIGADMAFITLGANDIVYTPEQFKQNMAALIATLRQNTSANLPIVLLSDPARGMSTPEALQHAEYFPRAAAELAAGLPRVCAVNSRRLTHEQGWTADDLAAFTVDQVHYTPQSAALKANLEVDALWSSFVCAADLGRQGGETGADGQLDNNDFIAFISAYFANKPIADLGGQGGQLGGDGQLDNNDFIAFISAFFAGCP